MDMIQVPNYGRKERFVIDRPKREMAVFVKVGV